MLTTLRIFAVMLAATLTVSATSIDIVNRQIDTKPGEKLVVDIDFGSITVIAGGDDKVGLEANRKINFGNEAKEKEYFAAVPITFTKEGNVVTVRSRGEKPHHWSLFHCQTEATYSLHVPKKFDVELRTDGGEINATDINGNLSAHTSGGRMTFARLEGKLDGETSGGFIDLADCRGPINIETSGGHIKVTGGQGTLNAHTSGGHIEVHNFAGDTNVRTSGGSLDLEKMSGVLIGKTSGGGIHASVLSPVNGDVQLETSAGSIELALPESAALNIDASTSVGHVTSTLPIQASDVKRDHLRGTLNGGGKSVRLATSAGSITIKPISDEVATLNTPPRHE